MLHQHNITGKRHDVVFFSEHHCNYRKQACNASVPLPSGDDVSPAGDRGLASAVAIHPCNFPASYFSIEATMRSEMATSARPAHVQALLLDQDGKRGAACRGWKRKQCLAAYRGPANCR